MKLTRNERRKVCRMVGRILARWEHATADQLSEGLAWYDRARESARAIAQATGLTLDRAAGIIAALSPRVRWGVNLTWAGRLATAAAAGLPCPALSFGRARRQAWAIARGGNPADILTGPKVTRFYRAIMGDRFAIVVDVWSALAAEGRRVRRGPDRRRYLLIEYAYRLAGAILGHPGRDIQAATWVSIRGGAG